MEFLGVGPLELLFILIIVLLVFGPKDIAKGARTLGRSLNRLYKSENYKLIQKASQELRDLPNRLVQEADLEELEKLKQMTEHELKELKAAADPNLPDKPLRAWVEELPNHETGPNASAPASPPAPAVENPEKEDEPSGSASPSNPAEQDKPPA